MKIKSVISIAALTTGIAFTMPTFADGQGHQHGHSDANHMMDSKGMGDHMNEMNEHHRIVMGQGRINKIMADRHMLNIKHEPMPEMNWPQMSMNFKTQKQVDLSSLKPGQEVEFKLVVDDNNNYLIKDIKVK